jgi:PAS domain S-box-containing protein
VFFCASIYAHAETPAPRTIRVGVLNDNFPFSYAASSGEIEGFVVDLLAEIEKATNLRLERIVGPTREINGAFETGHLDLLQSYAPSPERSAFAAFSQPYLKMSGSIFTRKNGPTVRNLADLKGRRVMVHRGSKGEQVLRAAGLADSIVYVASVEESLRLLDAGENDATLVGRLSGLALAQHFGLKRIAATGDPAYEVDYCFAVRKGDEDLLRRIDEGILILRQPGGSYETIYRKWFGQLGGYTRRDVLLAVTVGLAIALLVATWALVRQRSLHRRILRQAEELKASEERYREVFESSLDGLLVLSATTSGSPDHKIADANPKALQLLQLNKHPASEILLSQVLADGAELAKRITAALAPGASSVFEYERPKGSTPLWLRVSVGRMGERILAVLADITEAKAAEERMRKHDELLRQHQKLEAIGTMASGIAHDFNNILTGIVGNAELARMDLPEDHVNQPFLSEILGCSTRARKLVRQILSFCRRDETRRETIEARPVIEEVLSLLQATAPKSIELIYQPNPQTCPIEADPTQLHQVLLNLCTNAVQAMPDKTGRIEILEESVNIRPEEKGQHGRLKPGRYAHLSIKDNGSGMPPEVQQRIFEPFFTTKAPGEGTGLGLSVVHGILQSHGGDITVYSKPGQGTVFHLYLPAATHAAVNTSAATHFPRGKGERILIVDDETTIAETARHILEKIGYKPTAFTDPVAALEEFRRAPSTYQAVLCDLTMPKMSGLELAELIDPAIPFILMSGYVSEADHARAKKLGAAHVIEKPIDMPTLATLLAECLKQRR